MTSKPTSKVTVQIDATYRGLIGAKQLQVAAEQALLHQQAPNGTKLPMSFELTIVITSDEQVHSLNRQYRNVDAPTDVLAFAMSEAVGEVEFVNAPDEPTYLGDVIISYPRAQAQAQAAGHPASAELQLLTIHGVLHLIGYDHATPTQKQEMWAAQDKILRIIGVSIEMTNDETEGI